MNGKAKQVVYWTALANDANVQVCQSIKLINQSIIQVKLSDEHIAYKWCSLEEALEVIDPTHVTSIEVMKKAHLMVMLNKAQAELWKK